MRVSATFPDATQNRILPITRVAAIVVLPFLVVAVVLLLILPTRTEELFAWTIAPPLTAMLLGSAYAGGIWFFVQVVRQRQWSHVRYGFPAVFVFAGLLLVSTLLHWDRFHHGHPSFAVWVTLYVITPPLVLAAWLTNRTQDDGRSEPGEVRLPLLVRAALAGLGILALLTGVALFVLPQTLLDVWPWTLTPLTARVTGAILTLPGLVNVWMLIDSRWSAFRWMVQSELASLICIVSALIVGGDALHWNRPGALLFVAAIVAALAGYTWVYLHCERRRRATIVSGS